MSRAQTDPSRTLAKLTQFQDPRIALRNIQNGIVVVYPGSGYSAQNPVPATRGGALAFVELSYNNLKKQLLPSRRLFEDPEFPAEESSLFYHKSMPKGLKWLRPREICKNPQFISRGATRFDVRQGSLGDCWLLAAIASLTLNRSQFIQVVPEEQSFTNEYCGMFRFHIWRAGEWKEVIVDDRLPTIKGSLVFIQSADPNEFWSALLEKAYAKLCGSYEALTGGLPSEALVDFTGGLAETFQLRDQCPPDMFKIMLKSQERGSFMTGVITVDPARIESVLPNGLVMGHAYSVTLVKLFEKSLLEKSSKTRLIRLRNPWGNATEWNGAWSDKSREWTRVSAEIRRQLGLVFDNDGEFWMCFEDFKKNFNFLEICHLGPQSFGDQNDVKGRQWTMGMVHGQWQRGVSAGGCLKYIQMFPINPQIHVTVVDPDENDDDNHGSLIVGLMQKDRRQLLKYGKDFLPIGYAIFEIPRTFSSIIDDNFFKSNASKAKSSTFTSQREVCNRHKLKPGHYVIVPSTYFPNQEADFLLRIFSEKPLTTEQFDEVAGLKDLLMPIPTLGGSEYASLRKSFIKVAGEDGEIDPEELRNILNVAFTTGSEAKHFKFDGFTVESCRSLVSMMDFDRSGKLNFGEYAKLWNYIRLWKTAFKKHDADKSGSMNSTELRKALKAAGFSINNSTFGTLVLRFSQRDGCVPFDDFVVCCARLKTALDLFASAQKTMDGQAMFDETLFVNTVVYM